MASPILRPDYIDFVSWANQLWLSLGTFVPVATSEEKWKDWAAYLFTINTLVGIPDPSDFDTWQDWAVLLISSYRKVG